MSEIDPLERAVREIAAETAGSVGVAVRDLSQGRSVEINADRVFPSASVIKVPILVTLFQLADEGALRLDEFVRLREEDRVEGSGVLSMLHSGVELTLEDLAWLMITVSDNSASNLLIGKVTCEAVNRRMTALGLARTQLGRKFYDFDARDRGLENWITAGDMAELLAKIERREAASPAACERMLSILKRQQFDGRIPKLLPPGTEVANKTGSVTGVCHDVGVLYTPAGPLALAVLTQGVETPAVAEGVIRHIARVVYERWGGCA